MPESTNSAAHCSLPDRQWPPREICIVGTGLIGTSLAKAFKVFGFNGTINGICLPEDTAASSRVHEIDSIAGLNELSRRAQSADIVFLCTPVKATLNILEVLGKTTLPPGLTISDTGSIKTTICNHARHVLPPSVTFVGGHPMAGSEKNGPGAADPYLFQNAAYVLTPSQTDSLTPHPLAGFLEKHLGCRVKILDPVVHDRIAAAISHVPHLLAVALVCAAQTLQSQDTDLFEFAAGGFRDMTRIAASPYSMWQDILESNNENIAIALSIFRSQLDLIQAKTGNGTAAELFESARTARAQVPSTAKGFMAPVADITVSAVDKPGFIAEMTTLLAQHTINIKDIELLKIREDHGGTFRLGFENAISAYQATVLLNKHGFSAWTGEHTDA